MPPVTKTWRVWLSRSTIFAVFFAITGFILAMKGHLGADYVSLIAAVHGWVTLRAVAEDYHERKSAGGCDAGK